MFEFKYSRQVFLERMFQDKSVKWNVIEILPEHLTVKQAEKRLQKVAIPPRACEGSTCTMIWSNKNGINRFGAVLRKGKWVKETHECSKN